jgi:RsiW-degrading membrane proteinase PrsW (M82 family)
VLAVPGHAIDAIFMGCYYGMAKRCDAAGDYAGRKRNLRLALLIPVLLHGFYDFCATYEQPVMGLVFLAFVIIMFIAASRLVRRMSESDSYIDQNRFDLW